MAKDEINAFLGAGTVYQGQLNFLGAVRIDGQFTGEIKSEGTLILGQDAKVEGNVSVSQLILNGSISGDITVAGKTVMHKTAQLTGELTTKSLIMEEGAVLHGNIVMSPARKNAAGKDSPN